MAKSLRVLLIEDSEEDAELILRELRRGGYEPQWRRVDTAAALADALRDDPWDVITCDYVMPRFSALSAMKVIRASDRDVPVIIVSGQVGEDVAVSAMKAGAHDYVSKLRLVRLVPAIEREIADARERQRAATTLSESDQRYRELVESLHDVVFEVGPDERLTYISPAITGLSEATPEEYVGRSFRDFIYPDDLPALLDSLQRTLTGVREPLIYRVMDPRGGVHWVRSSTRPVLDRHGGWRALRGVITDVTDQIEAEQAYQTVFEHSLQGLAVVQADRIVLANPALVALTGYSHEELCGASVLELTAAIAHPDDLERMTAATCDYLEGRARTSGFEFRIVRRDGRERRVITAHTDLPYRGRPARLLVYIDVTDRWQAEEAYRTIFERSVNGLAVVQGDRIRLANPAMTAITGRPLEELTTTPLEALGEMIVHPDDLAEQRRLTRLYLDGDRNDDGLAFRIVRPDGTARHIIAGRADFPYRGEPARLLTYVDDTERWQAEQAYRTIFEGTIHGMVLVQGNRIVMANPAVGEIVGLPGEVLLERPLSDVLAQVIHPDDLDLVRLHLERWLATGQVPRRHSFRIRRDDGTDGHLYLQTSIVSHRGAPAALVAIADLTDRWRAEEAYRAVFERSLEGLLVMSGPHVLMANQAATELSGYAIDELTRLQAPELLERLVHPDDRAALADDLAAYLTSGIAQPLHHEFRLRRRDGSERHVLSTCTPMTFAGRPAVLCGHLDITERWQAEAALCDLNAALEARVAERTAALQATARELEAFTHSASHDLRAPLRVIDGFCQALVEDYGDALPPGATVLLERVVGAAADMRRLLDQLLVLSRVARGELHRESLDLSALAREVAAELTRDDPGRIAVEIESGLHGEGDVALLRAALDNLLGNAVKFSRPRPRAEITVGAVRDNGTLVYFVRDNGVGFDPTYGDRLFHPFQRLHSSSEFSGHGIGLATVSRIITRHGGRIWAESRVDRGATFYFTLG
ncbi:MAG TPA: PAS domain S-box protein [Candidatus Dormibacteraeota bacterium]|nr:PAS domain S-box protein [Candidatus Dormibacteraeota bacterium]